MVNGGQVQWGWAVLRVLVCVSDYQAGSGRFVVAPGLIRGKHVMPIYEYVCSACGLEKDFIQRMSADPLTTCPACQGETLRKKISAAGFRLKGTGWYETDFKTGSKKNLAAESVKSNSSDTSGSTAPAASDSTTSAAAS